MSVCPCVCECVSNLPPESSSEEQKLVVSNWLLCWVDELSPPPVVSAPFCSTDWWAGLFRRPPTELTNQRLRRCNKTFKNLEDLNWTNVQKAAGWYTKMVKLVSWFFLPWSVPPLCGGETTGWTSDPCSSAALTDTQTVSQTDISTFLSHDRDTV